MKGIILVGGSGTRLRPITGAVNKHLLPIYDKPLIYYPLATLMLCGIREILVISRPEDQSIYKSILGDGSQWGIEFSYKSQPKPKGIAEAFIIGKNFIQGHKTVLILGDNIFFGHNLSAVLDQGKDYSDGATIFAYWVANPEQFGVVELASDGSIVSLEEKPQKPRSNYAVTGLYFYDSQVGDIAASLTPSPRGELEITDINKYYLKQEKLRVQQLGRGFAWLDTGTPDAMLDAANYIATIERRQGLKIACLEEIAWRLGWIDDTQMADQAARINNTDYGSYLLKLLSIGL